MLGIDLEELILEYEVIIRKSIPEGKRQSGRRKDLSTMDLWSAVRTMFWIEERNGVEELSLRDVKPLVIFQIRQLIEIYGKNCLGFYEIRNSNGSVNKRVTQEAWKFITDEVKRADSRILLPFNVDMINHVNDWANNFVHTTSLYSSYIQFYALEVISLLFKTPDVAIRTYDGKLKYKGGIAGIEIRNYNSLKRDFERSLSEKLTSEVVVDWLDVEKVGAYIIDLGAPISSKESWVKRLAARARRWAIGLYRAAVGRIRAY
ncbi:hypothetical protein ACQ86N_00095 [Puia sp. P3]|uniref:hypothetical protein n=1 Tax=Puia sp. P3 TaxID=3423952 RepID=UPI003D66BC33